MVVVVGPPLAGVSAVVVALRSRLPGALILDAADNAPARAPDAVVAVVSAVAPVTQSEWAGVERAAAGAGLLVAAVSKVDAQLGWRDVLAVDRARVAGWNPRRAALPWLGVAAAPDLGPVHVDELVEVLRAALDGPRRRPRPDLPAAGRRRAPTRASSDACSPAAGCTFCGRSGSGQRNSAPDCATPRRR